ncbi:bifunctional 2-polyprenyl-6-hydroxyphenol methylase/3-demethylubiquinol 3-O-methyltransferase UbiG [Avibacterium sp. 21-599]|uniref:bifunctional 2-polyprenyl-6-hydroxyphenol methylase/3-demethylubiquinol 3-O-methyltransferase UbiG n=1 Tax=Avibacterium sp. 21-599 TaxID=2911528 RepID=UPI0022468B38|nr:bifunctional 2-polyprenyl-6-hydroxyphenol methylase/3-demethylubiquinol 3-O-methyltransferase UbiG [Avibacterium sp. 21-599]MCW9718006.1 bifunctional 2-polyprenyl-6-hydroxyphenol methylase/3-demethylubiquinol 3-O-methyltransferase UbiG [Avibacterium sp. 21-599]
MQNIDQQELEKFEKMAKTWWDPEGDFEPIHRLNPLRLDYICQQAEGLFGKNVLDVGCGGGILAEAMAKQGANVTGIDMTTAPLEVAKLHAQENGLSIDYQQTTIENFLEKYTALDGEKFDVITCMEMLEHVPEPSSIINTCKALLKPNGVLFFSTINRTLKAWALVIIGAEYVLKMLPKGTHNYEKFIKPAELLAWTDRAELDCVNMVGYHYNPLMGTFKLNQDVSANYMATFKMR